MENKSILLGGTDELKQIRQMIESENLLKEEIQTLTADKRSMEKELETEVRLTQDTIASTTKKRRDELESGFDREIAANTSKLKTARGKKDSTKKKAVKSRMAEETQSLLERNKELKQEAKQALRDRKIPTYASTNWFYALFCTSTIKDFVIFAVVTVILIGLIPNAVCYFLVKDFWLWKVLAYVAIVVVVFIIYIIIFKTTKARDKMIFEELRPKKDEIRKNKKQIKKIRRKIKKDPDESQYNLSEFDSSIAEIENGLTQLKDRKSAAMREFDETTVKIIAKEISQASEAKILELKERSAEMGGRLSEAEKRLQDSSLKIKTDYETYLGSEFMNIEKIDILTGIIGEGKAATISEAIKVFKERP